MEKADRVLADIKRGDTTNLAFEGVAYGAFDGVLKAVDLQPETKRAVLWLSAGNMPVQCNITGLGIEDVRKALDQRAEVYGLAHYDGKLGLPMLLDIQRLEIIGEGRGLSGWRAAFEFPSEWPTENWDDV